MSGVNPFMEVHGPLKAPIHSLRKGQNCGTAGLGDDRHPRPRRRLEAQYYQRETETSELMGIHQRGVHSEGGAVDGGSIS